MDEEIKNLVRISTIRDVEIALLKAKQGGQIIPDIVLEIIRDIEKKIINE